MIRLGAHMSIAGGMSRAVERAVAVDATALALFVKSSNQWAARAFATGEAEAFRASAVAAGLSRHTVAHASYLVNLASPDGALRDRSAAAFREEVERCAALGIPYLVVHPGSHMGDGPDAGVARVAESLDRALGVARRGARGIGAPVEVLLEITAGAGHTLGSRFEEIAAMIERAKSSHRLGMCFDTCHALASGIEFRDARSYAETFRRLDRTVGLDRLKAFHLNDSKGDLGGRLDRHEHIGRGKVGLDAFRLILNDRRFRDVPMVLETPKGDDLAEDRVNLAVLRSLVRA